MIRGEKQNKTDRQTDRQLLHCKMIERGKEIQNKCLLHTLTAVTARAITTRIYVCIRVYMQPKHSPA